MTISQMNANQLRHPDDDGLGPIVRIGPEHRPQAIARLLATGPLVDREHARRFIEYATKNRVNLDGTWSRLDEFGNISATVLTVPSPGRTAMVFASHPRNRESIRAIGGLIRHAVRELRSSAVNLAQTLLDPSEVFERDAYLHAGFSDLAVLSYLERPLKAPLSSGPPPGDFPPGFSIVTYDDSMRDELVRVLGESYEQTLDCPGLRGHRRTEDILEGHRASGLFDPALWTVLRESERAVGALLLNPAADGNAIELVYLGLSPSSRGKSLGRSLLRYGLRRIANRNEKTIHLAVDEANAPAARLYASEGFRLALRRRALIHPLA